MNLEKEDGREWVITALHTGATSLPMPGVFQKKDSSCRQK